MTGPRPPRRSGGDTEHGPASPVARPPSDTATRSTDPASSPRPRTASDTDTDTDTCPARGDHWSRRGFLGRAGLGVAALVTGGAGVTGADDRSESGRAADGQSGDGRAADGQSDGAGADDATELTFLTRNLSLGVDFSRLASARSAEAVPRVVGALLADIDASHPEKRVRAVADEIVDADPAVVGLQEAALVRTERPADSPDGTADAGTVRYDFLDSLAAELAARGADYRVAVSGVSTDLEAPGDVDGERVDVRLTDRDVLLVRGDLSTRDPRAHVYDASLVVPVGDGRTIGIDRGFVAVDVAVGGRTVTVANTHLEAASSLFRRAQAGELRDRIDGDAVVLGDLNSAPGEGAYDLLTESFDDAWAAVGPGSDGATCCQDGDLRNEASDLTRRIDHVLVRGLDAVSAARVGAGDDARIEVDGVRLWPSDHAGVLATLRVPDSPTADTTATSATSERGRERTPTATPTADAEVGTGETPATASSGTTGTNATPTASPATAGTVDGSASNPITEASAPGFSAVGALASLLAASALALCRPKEE